MKIVINVNITAFITNENQTNLKNLLENQTKIQIKSNIKNFNKINK